MKRVYIVALLIHLISLEHYSYAQDDGPKVVVFNSGDNEDEKNEIYAKNLFKFGLLGPFAGDFSFYYERVISQGFSVEAGLGITIEDYIEGVLDSDAWVGSSDNLFGPSALIGFRYYPISTPEEFYIAAEFKHKQYRSEQFADFDDNTYIRSSIISKFRLTFGYQVFVYDNVFWDLFGGFGLGSESLVNYTEEFANPNDPNSNSTVIVKNKERNLKPYIHIGVKIGLTFNQN